MRWRCHMVIGIGAQPGMGTSATWTVPRGVLSPAPCGWEVTLGSLPHVLQYNVHSIACGSQAQGLGLMAVKTVEQELQGSTEQQASTKELS